MEALKINFTRSNYVSHQCIKFNFKCQPACLHSCVIELADYYNDSTNFQTDRQKVFSQCILDQKNLGISSKPEEQPEEQQSPFFLVAGRVVS